VRPWVFEVVLHKGANLQVVVDALARGEQVLILRKGGIHEQRGEFRVSHREFWLFPTQYHEAESSVIPSRSGARCPGARCLGASRRGPGPVVENLAPSISPV
jgi:hypothetical protein